MWDLTCRYGEWYWDHIAHFGPGMHRYITIRTQTSFPDETEAWETMCEALNFRRSLTR